MAHTQELERWRGEDVADRDEIAEEATKLIEDARVNLRVLAEEAGINYKTLTVIFSRGGSHMPIRKYLPDLADALEKKGGELAEIAERLRKLSEE